MPSPARYPQDKHQCPVCKWGFMSPYVLGMHMAAKHSDKIVHVIKTEVDERVVVKTVAGLQRALSSMPDALYRTLDDEVAVERIKVHLSNGKVRHEIRVRSKR